MRSTGIRRKAIPAAILALTAFQAHAIRIDYSIDTGIERDDNVLMDSQDASRSTSSRIGLGFRIEENNSTVQASINGLLEYRNHFDGDFADTTEGELAARLNWVIVPGNVSFSLDESLSLQAVDRFAPDSQDNRQQVNVLSLGPNFHFNWSRTFQGDLEFRWIDSNAEYNDSFNSTRLAGAMRLTRQFGPTHWMSFNLEANDIDFDSDLSAGDYRRYDVYLNYRQSFRAFEYDINAGYSYIDYVDRTDNVTHPRLQLSGSWSPNQRNSLSLILLRQLSDTATAAIEGLDTSNTAGIPGRLIVGGSSVDASVYEENRASLAYIYRTPRTRWLLSPYYSKIDYVDAASVDETRRGNRLSMTRELTATWNLDAYWDISRAKFDTLSREQEDNRVGVTLSREWSRRWSTSLAYSRYVRDTDTAEGKIAQNIWYLSIGYRNW